MVAPNSLKVLVLVQIQFRQPIYGNTTFFRKVDRPSKETLEKEINENTMVSLGKKYGVSDNSIRKWCINYGINL